MLQNASYIFLKEGTKQHKTKWLQKKQKVSRSRSRTRDLRRVRAMHYPLHHETIANTVRQIICI